MKNRSIALALSMFASFPVFAEERSPVAIVNGAPVYEDVRTPERIENSISRAHFEDSVWRPPEFMAPDACANLVGYQADAPSGYQRSGANCLAPCTAPASTFVDESMSCPVGNTGSMVVRTTTSYSCPSSHGDPVPSASSAVLTNSCAPTARWPWDGNHRDVVAIKIACTTSLDRECGQNNGNLPEATTNYNDQRIYMGFGYANIPSWLHTSSAGSNWLAGRNVRPRINDLKTFLVNRGYRVISIYLPTGSDEYYNVYSFTASMGENLYVGWATVINHETYGWDWTESSQARSAGTSERYYIPMPMPYAGYTGALQPNGQMRPQYLGAFSTTEFNESAYWQWAPKSFHVNISPPLPSNMYYCDDIWKRGYNTRTTGSRIIETNYLMKRWCSIGKLNFATWRDVGRTSSSIYKDFSGVVPYLPWAFPQETMMEPPSNRPY